jgi:molecular chaperone HscB
LRATYLLELQGINAFDEKDTQMDVDFLMSQIELRESLEAIKTTKDEMALEDFIVDITGKVAQNIEALQQQLILAYFSAFCLVLEAFFSAF